MLSAKKYNGLKADIWSAGIVLYAMCFGYLPFDDPNTAELYRLIKTGTYEIPEGCSASLISLLKRMLEVDPENRATIEEIKKHPFCRFVVESNNRNLGSAKYNISHLPSPSKLNPNENDHNVDLSVEKYKNYLDNS